ncbi:hypothetical protein BS47DRAFT_1369858 [Hydnum rufescens UP504]|uniref:Uncharacterized protein n=1 Tax=Hydnum rufescens UP504 TaxID=1448309 RepID=A0A9P6ABF0_9AGAM|nr:hypothetical protein BS47DRAFT_1369858 [Hydnum rufescens UP504]
MARNTEMIKKKVGAFHFLCSFNWMLRYHQSSKANRPSQTDETACEIEDKKHEVSTNQDAANAALVSFMKPILEPHGIGTKKTKTGIGWAFPGKQLALKLCAKKIMLVGWPTNFLFFLTS